MKALSLVLAILSLALGGPILLRHRSRATLMLLIPKFLGTALAPYVALAGALGAVIGLLARFPLAIVGGALGAGVAANYVRRVTAPHDGFTCAFGPDWSRRIPPRAEGRMLQRRWTWWTPKVPEPRWTRDVAFWTIPGSERMLLADIWEPPAGVEPAGTAIVYLHGSAWYLMDKDVLTRSFFRHLAAQGHVVMDVAYRLCPEVDVTGMVGDAKRAVAWMKANAATYGVNPQRVVLMGASAGGHVALLAAYGASHPRLTPDELQGVDTSVMALVSYYGVPDLRAYGEHTAARLAEGPAQPGAVTERRQPGALENYFNRLLLGRTLTAEQSPPSPPHREMMRQLVGGQPGEVPEMYDLASPIHHVSPASPPTLLFHGEHDSIVPVASARRLYQALTTAGVPALYVEFPQAEHAFDILYPPFVGPAAQAALYDLERFLVCVGTGNN
ncbi:MAG: alpha/beta hydrolase [Caldilineaceae bacterium]|nr:alpha/beta hydrolase [Caldilineaceae bacterium]